MGPRLISRGVNECADASLAAIPASMGPRLISRGVTIIGDDDDDCC